MLDCLVVGLGGALGAVLRYLITLLPLSPQSGFPLKTFLINVAGSFVIGLVAALAVRNGLSDRVSLFLRVGICGGFTTFSSFALETEGLLSKGSTGVALLYVVLSIVCGVLAVIVADRIVA